MHITTAPLAPPKSGVCKLLQQNTCPLLFANVTGDSGDSGDYACGSEVSFITGTLLTTGVWRSIVVKLLGFPAYSAAFNSTLRAFISSSSGVGARQ